MRLHYPIKQNGMFVLSGNDIDRIASQVLNEYEPNVLESPRPLDIEHLMTECFYLTIEDTFITIDGSVLGLVAFHDTEVPCFNTDYRASISHIDAGTVLVDARLAGSANHARRRFTMAHECSHWICHRTYHAPDHAIYELREDIRVPYIACRTESIEQYRQMSCAPRDDKFWMEWQADRLAASLLMPKNTFIRAAEDVMREHLLFRLYLIVGRDHDQSCRVIDDLAQLFQVSRRATQIRLKQVGMLIDTERSCRQWQYSGMT